MAAHKYKAVTTGPLTGPERTWVHDLPQDNLVSALIMCTAELCRLQDEIAQMKTVISANGIAVPPRGDAPGRQEKLAQEEATGVLVRRILGELFRSGEGWTGVDPRVAQFFKQPQQQAG